MTDSLISIVIPVYNRSTIVVATLNSIVSQTFRPFNVILVDNGSTDDTKQTLLHWKKTIENTPEGKGINITVAECHKPGAAAARNVGLDLVTTPWVMFFDSDDIMSKKHLAFTIEDINSNPKADLIGWNTEIIDTTGKFIRISPFSTSSPQWRNLFNGLLSTQHYCVRTDIMRQAGKWNENVFYWIDIELGTRILILRPSLYKSKYNDKRVTIIRSDNSITSTPDTDPGRIEPALVSISKTLGPDKQNLILLKKVIEAAVCSRAGSKKGHLLYKSVIRECSNLYIKVLLKLAFSYTKWGGRGIAKIYKYLGFDF